MLKVAGLGPSTLTDRNKTLLTNVAEENLYGENLVSAIGHLEDQDVDAVIPNKACYLATDKQLNFIAALAKLDELEYVQLYWIRHVYGLDMTQAHHLIESLKGADM